MKQCKKILVTGGTGFIGAGVVKGLVDQGNEVRVLDNNYRGHTGRLDGYMDKLEFIEGDIRDRSTVFKAVEGMEVIYHLAFINGTKHFYEIPEKVLEVGVKGALNTLEATIEFGLERYVLASSSEVYQTPMKIPTDESERIYLEDITNPRYSYAGGKIISELLALNYLRKTNTDCVIFRPHNIYGADMGWEHVIPEIMVKLHKATNGFSNTDATIEIQGDGSETRAFCYIDNAVEGFILCGEKGGDGEIYHVGEMREISIRELIEKMAGTLGINLKIIPGKLMPGGTPRRCPDTKKIESLGYAPEITLEEGLKRTLEWYKKALSTTTP
jgi:nucleoside-diphosphate-sugar epimerase